MIYGREEVKFLLLEEKNLIEKGHYTKSLGVGDVTYLRGLIELSNICIKDCLYCGIRRSNSHTDRYTLTDEEVLSAARYAYENSYGSIAIQAGEITDSGYIKRITSLIERIKAISNGELGITLSLGEQKREVYREWFRAGAERYLLRIESSNADLYRLIHPHDALHSHTRRVEALSDLKEEGYQVGTGVMIGLPFQNEDNLVDDLLFMRDMDIDMCGMGPYLEHKDTPLYAHRDTLHSEQWRFDMTIRMVATLRILMPKINIAATTALQAIEPLGRERALYAGANVIMPNITPTISRASYKLYENKPISEDCLDIQDKRLFERIEAVGDKIGYGIKGTSRHYKERDKGSLISINKLKGI